MRETAGLLSEREPEADFDFSQTSYILVENHHRPRQHNRSFRQVFNVIVCTGFEKQTDIGLLFDERDEFLLVDDKTTMADLLVRLHLFSSKGQARKSRKEFAGPIPPGWSEFSIGERWLFIWKPTE